MATDKASGPLYIPHLSDTHFFKDVFIVSTADRYCTLSPLLRSHRLHLGCRYCLDLFNVTDRRDGTALKWHNSCESLRYYGTVSLPVYSEGRILFVLLIESLSGLDKNKRYRPSVFALVCIQSTLTPLWRASLIMYFFPACRRILFSVPPHPVCLAPLHPEPSAPPPPTLQQPQRMSCRNFKDQHHLCLPVLFCHHKVYALLTCLHQMSPSPHVMLLHCTTLLWFSQHSSLISTFTLQCPASLWCTTPLRPGPTYGPRHPPPL